MKTLGLTYLLLLLLCPLAVGQSLGPTLVGTTGYTKSASGYSISYSVGEVSVTTHDGDYYLTQGYQQPLKKGDSGPYSIEVYPTLVSETLKIEFQSTGTSEFWVEIFNLKGSLLFRDICSEVSDGTIKHLNIEKIPKGMYILKIYSLNGRVLEKFKIVKM